MGPCRRYHGSALRRADRAAERRARAGVKFPFRRQRPVPGLPLPAPGEPTSAMVVVAHPDDAEFMCGGTVARWCAEGWDVWYVLATSGDKGTRDLEVDGQYLAAVREREQREAGKALGLREVIFLGHPDGFLVNSHELRGQVVRLLRRYRPNVVITWDPFASRLNHTDHRIIGQATLDAAFPASRDHLYYPRDYAEDGMEPHRVADLLLAASASPDYHVDVTAHLGTKLDALMKHESQIGQRTREDILKRWSGKTAHESFRRIHLGSLPGGRSPGDEEQGRTK
ncbi:MAG: PIG-L family deacetylase [Dehalococcoidia bacterium]|nr:PIG-L family deacetylase [Dehalococcoidia bacterium]